MAKSVDENIGVLRWFSHAKRVYVGLCAVSCLVGRPRKRWIDTVKDCLKKIGLDVRQARKMVHDSV